MQEYKELKMSIKYNFETNVIYAKRYSSSKEEEKAEVILNHDSIYINYKRKIYERSGFGQKKSERNMHKEKKSSISNIDCVKFKRGKGYISICWTGIVIFVLLFFFFGISEITRSKDVEDVIGFTAANAFFAIAYILIATPIAFLIGVPDREMLIKFKDNEKIRIPYYAYNSYNKINNLICDLKDIQQDIKIINQRIITNIIIAVILLCGLFIQGLSLHIKYDKYKEENLKKIISQDKYYDEVEFRKVNFIKRDILFNENIYKIIETGETIKVKENAKRENIEYGAFILKYYSIDNKELIATRYKILDQSNGISSFVKYKTEFFYDYNSDKIFEFNIPDADLNKETNYSKGKVDFYYKDNKESKDQAIFDGIYKFVYSNSNERKLNNSKYINFSKMGNYKSKYGMCYIIKASQKNSMDYIMYIETLENDYCGIIYTYRGDLYGNYQDIDYFKSIIFEE